MQVQVSVMDAAYETKQAPPVKQGQKEQKTTDIHEAFYRQRCSEVSTQST